MVTTNFDIWIERGMRYRAMPRRKRPGFNYGIAGSCFEANQDFHWPRSFTRRT